MTERRNLTDKECDELVATLDNDTKAALSEAARILCTGEGGGAGPLPIANMTRALVRSTSRLRALVSRGEQLVEALEGLEVLIAGSGDDSADNADAGE